MCRSVGSDLRELWHPALTHQRTGKDEKAREHLATTTTMYREMDMTYWLEKADAVTIDPVEGV